MSIAVSTAPGESAPARRGTALIAFGIAFAATLVVALLLGLKTFYYDSGGYWILGTTYIRNGHFSLLNFESSLRGYLLPLIDHGLQGLAVAFRWNPSSFAKLFNVLSFALIGTVLGPRLAEITWPRWRWGIGRRLALMALLLIFWKGYLPYPLSDFPAFTLALLALVSIDRVESPGWMLLGGLASAAAIDMRPSYLLLAPILVVLIVWAWLKGRSRENPSVRWRVLCGGLFLVGFFVISLPQSLSSHRYFHTWSFVPGSAAHLTTIQFDEGLHLQRYETYVGSNLSPRMLYEDPTGTKLLLEQKDQTVSSTSQYLGLVASHPLTMAGVFIRHIVNGLDQRYSTPYVSHLSTGSNRWLRLAGFLLIFLALLRVLWSTARRRLAPARWRYPAALALCCLTSVPSAVETRYMLPIFLLSYILVLVPGWPNPVNFSVAGLRRYQTVIVIAVAYLIFMALIWDVVSHASQHLNFGMV
jgi:hypothetical protein